MLFALYHEPHQFTHTYSASITHSVCTHAHAHAHTQMHVLAHACANTHTHREMLSVSQSVDWNAWFNHWMLNLSTSMQSAAGLKALKPAANGCKSFNYPTLISYIYCTQVHLFYPSGVNNRTDKYENRREKKKKSENRTVLSQILFYCHIYWFFFFFFSKKY